MARNLEIMIQPNPSGTFRLAIPVIAGKPVFADYAILRIGLTDHVQQASQINLCQLRFS